MASKSKRRGRVFRASCILAALIIAGSSFAWFTSKDEVTNRLTANADYGVSIVESFTPPKNWIPGEEVNKDTYAVNTGSIPAYVRSDVSGVLSLTTEKPVEIKYGTGEEAGVAKNFVVYEDTDSNPATPDEAVDKAFTTGTNFDSFIKLDEDEVFSVEAGSYLAYKPAASQQSLGKQVVIYPSNAATKATTVYKCDTADTYGGKAYAVGDTISAATFENLSSADKTSFEIATYRCKTAGDYGNKHFEVGDTITATQYADSNYIPSGDQGNFEVATYTCKTAGTYGKKSYTADQYISEEEFNSLPVSDQGNFTAEELSDKGVIYKVKTAFTAYSVDQILTPEQYAALTDAEKNNITVVDVAASKTDFIPDVEGLYVFRRTVVVNNNATEQFTYDGYYFKDGAYYKITDLEVTQDDSMDPNEKKEELDVAGDGNDKDGQLADAKAKFLVDDTTIYYEPETFTYDEANNRLVATYLTTTNDKYNSYKAAAQLLDQREHELAQARTALDRALNDAAASDAQVAFYTNRIAQLQNELNAVNARISQLVGNGTKNTPDDGSIIDNLNDEEKRLSHTGTPKGVIQTAQAAAEESLKTLYGKDNSANSVATAELTNIDSDDFGKVQYGSLLLGNLPATVSDLACVDNATPAESLYRQYLEAKEEVEAARASDAYGHDLFTAYVNELETLYATELGSATNLTYEDILNKLSYVQLNDASTHFSQSPELHAINELTAKLVKAKKAYEDELANYKSQVQNIKVNTQRLGDEGTTETVASTAASGYNQEIVGGATIKYDKVTVKDESGAKGDTARAKAEYDTLASKKTALENAIAEATTAAINAENVGGTAGGTDASTQLSSAYTAYQTASKKYDEALNDYNAKKKAYENGNPLKIYINLSENVVTEAAGLADRWQLLPVSPLVSKYTKDGRVIGEDGVQDDGTPKTDTAVFYYTSILDAGETSSKLVDSVTLDSGVTQGMYKAFDYDLNVGLDSAQITYTGADNATISTIPANTEFGAKYDKGLSGNVINGATATLTNDKSLDTAVNWTVDDDPAN